MAMMAVYYFWYQMQNAFVYWYTGEQMGRGDSVFLPCLWASSRHPIGHCENIMLDPAELTFCSSYAPSLIFSNTCFKLCILAAALWLSVPQNSLAYHLTFPGRGWTNHQAEWGCHLRLLILVSRRGRKPLVVLFIVTAFLLARKQEGQL